MGIVTSEKYFCDRCGQEVGIGKPSRFLGFVEPFKLSVGDNHPMQEWFSIGLTRREAVSCFDCAIEATEICLEKLRKISHG